MKATDLRNAMGAIHARYRVQPWYVGTERANDHIRLIVTKACPFESHRKVADVPVKVVLTTQRELAG